MILRSARSGWSLICITTLACSLQMPSEQHVFGGEGASSSGGAASGGEQASGGDQPAGGERANGSAGTGGQGASAGAASGNAGGGAANGGSAPGGSGAFEANAGLTAYFPFDETSGTVAANLVDGSKSGSYFGACTHPAGKRGMAVGVRNQPTNSDWVELPAGLLSGLSAATLSIWVRDLSTARKGGRLFDFSRSAAENIYFAPDDDNGATSAPGAHLGGTHAGAPFVDVWAPAPVMTDKLWHHVAVTWTSASIDLYLDGAPAGSNAKPGVSPSELGVTTPNWLGKTLDDSFISLYAEIDELRVYNRSLSATDVGKLYQAP